MNQEEVKAIMECKVSDIVVYPLTMSDFDMLREEGRFNAEEIYNHRIGTMTLVSCMQMLNQAPEFREYDEEDTMFIGVNKNTKEVFHCFADETETRMVTYDNHYSVLDIRFMTDFLSLPKQDVLNKYVDLTDVHYDRLMNLYKREQVQVLSGLFYEAEKENMLMESYGSEVSSGYTTDEINNCKFAVMEQVKTLSEEDQEEFNQQIQ